MKYIFCDLDGTLLKDFYKVEEDDILALRKAQNNGIKISVATGRLDYEIKHFMNKYALHGYRVSQNGGVVFNDQNEIVHKVSLTPDDVKLILKALNKFNVLYFFETENEYIVQKKLKLMVEFEKTQPFLTYVEKSDILETIDQHEIVTVSLWAEKNENIRIKQYLDQVLPNHITSFISSIYTIDITSNKNSKGNAIAHLCNIYEIDANDIAVIGDSHNDIPMFNLTKNSFVIDSAADEVKSKATYVVNSVKAAVDIILKHNQTENK